MNAKFIIYGVTVVVYLVTAINTQKNTTTLDWKAHIEQQEQSVEVIDDCLDNKRVAVYEKIAHSLIP